MNIQIEQKIKINVKVNMRVSCFGLWLLQELGIAWHFWSGCPKLRDRRMLASGVVDFVMMLALAGICEIL